jgi:hypothetical protein
VTVAAERGRNGHGKALDAASKGRRAAELASLKQKLTEAERVAGAARKRASDAEAKLAVLQKAEAHKRLSESEKKTLIGALKPFSGAKVTIASILDDNDGKLLAEDLAAVFDAAGWDHNGEAGISYQRFERDPVGVEVTLNEDDARAGKISAGVGALINVVRELGLTRDNTIYMNGDIPAGEVQLKVGRKLRK